MWKLALPVLIYLCYVNTVINAQVQFRVVRQWKFINYTWPTSVMYSNAVASGLYIPDNIIMAGITYYDNHYYVTMPRMRNGVPATLGRFTSLPGSSTSPLIEPFPSWDYNKVSDCEALQNVQNIEIDPNGFMYILDGGHTLSLSQNPQRNCPPQLIIYSIPKNETKITHFFPHNVANQLDSFLYDLVIDGDFVYITDNSASDPGIIVYSKQENRSWKIRHPTMRGNPDAQQFKVNGDVIDVKINVAGIALGPKIQQGKLSLRVNQDREVFYSPISSLNLYSISTGVLRNESNSNNGTDYPEHVRDVGLKASQSDGMVMTNRGVLFYGLLGDNSIAQWDSTQPFVKGQKVVSRDVNYIQWTNAFTIDTNGTLSALSNTLQKFVHAPLDVSRYNFWVISAHIEEKSYLYDDPDFEYIPFTTTTQATWSEPPSPAPPTNKTKPDSTNEIDETPANQKGDGNRQFMEFSAVLIAVMVWVLNRN